MPKGNKLFDEIEDEDNGYGEETEEGPTHLDMVRKIFVEAKIDIDDEDINKKYDTILILASGIRMGFDEEGKLLNIWNE